MKSNTKEHCPKHNNPDVASITTHLRNWYAIFLFVCSLAGCAWYGHNGALTALVQSDILGPCMAVGVTASLLVFFLFGRVGRNILCFIVCLGLCGWVVNIVAGKEGLSDILSEALRWAVLVTCCFLLEERHDRPRGGEQPSVP